MNKFDLNNRTAVITGGAQGFGLDIAKKFLDFGAKVIIWDIDEQQLQITSKEINSSKFSYDRGPSSPNYPSTSYLDRQNFLEERNHLNHFLTFLNDFLN